jgi:hypothetical protein
MTSATANNATIALNGAAVSTSAPPTRSCPTARARNVPTIVDREDPPALRRLGLGTQPALGCDEEPGAAEPDDRVQDQPGQWSDQERHSRGPGDDQAGEGVIGADVPDPLDDPSAAQRAQRETAE